MKGRGCPAIPYTDNNHNLLELFREISSDEDDELDMLATRSVKKITSSPFKYVPYTV